MNPLHQVLFHNTYREGGGRSKQLSFVGVLLMFSVFDPKLVVNIGLNRNIGFT